MVKIIIIILLIVISYRFRFSIIVLLEDMLEAVKESYKDHRYKRLIAKELNRMEFKKFTTPFESLCMWIAVGYFVMMIMLIIFGMLDYSTKTDYEQKKYVYDCMTQELIKEE